MTATTIGPGSPRLTLLPGVAIPERPERRREFAANASVTDREDLTPVMARFVIRPDGPIPPFEPGQYFSLGLPGETGVLLRPYSTASPRGTTDALEFLVRRVSTGGFTPALWRTAVGDRIWIGPPKGLFRLKRGDPRTHLLVSSGTGIAPFISMIDELLIRGEAGDDNAQPRAQSRPRVVVVHGVSYVAELAYRSRLEEAAFADPGLNYIPTVSRPDEPQNAGWMGRTGRVESALAGVCGELRLDASDAVAYLCGNPEMITRSREALRGLGFPADAIVHENYWAAPGA
jgi:ferredoxin--NADP+ reductase